ncbi:MAG: sulfurtransferase [Phyllobacteriaceae bacterium]|nr:sulfurtransferase [Phyllobacteriaceae bacterium]
MPAPNAISVEKLARLIGTPASPLIIDVRTDDDFAADPRHIPASRRISHGDEATLAALPSDRTIVVSCHKGLKLSEGVAALLRLRGIDAMNLEGGHLAWVAAQQPLVPASAIPVHASAGHSRWVTRHRPKIDRIACPWLILRFVDPQAEFLYVTPDQVTGVAERFDATPFDMETGFWTHEGENCTFDKMLSEFGLKTVVLLRLADIVRCADTNRLGDNPQAAGLLAISVGLSRQYSDDLEQLRAGLAVYDALYRWCRDGTDEVHSWPVRAKT